MKAIDTRIPEVKIIEPEVFTDNRGHFFESFNERDFFALIRKKKHFVQDNHSRSTKGVLRGLHYQISHPQGKLVRVVNGEIFDVAVDIRRSSPSFGKWTGVTLSAENKLQLWVPEGFAHGFLALSPSVDVLYKTTDYRYPEHERALNWNDGDIAIDWPLDSPPILSMKDASANSLMSGKIEIFE